MAQKPASPWYFASATGGLTDSSDHAMVAANSGCRNFISSLQFSNESTTVSSEFVIKDGSNVIWRGFAPKSMTTTENMVFDPPLQSSSNSPLNVTMITTGTATVISAQGFIDP